MMRPINKLAVASTNDNVVFVGVELLAPNEPCTPTRSARPDCTRRAVGQGLAARNNAINVISKVAAPGLNVVAVVVAKPNSIAIRTRDASALARPTIHTAYTGSQGAKVSLLASGRFYIDITGSADIANDVGLDDWLEYIARKNRNKDISYRVALVNLGCLGGVVFHQLELRVKLLDLGDDRLTLGVSMVIDS